ncbi:Rab geranylgeranyltransferase [Cladophialophora chaetospira]|uniref:Geranylgeranyl transferase type-2 subunit alpha n=1 Tax=Cladophialophora chaetospira TaxID=386627 RepID=A0AA38XJR2_9EURO|nr:Rab geranylgeranyltransferase [Cladophialophora chaetospira]
MASHGVPRAATREERTAEARQKELKEISQYQQLVEEVNTKVAAKEFTPELLQKTAELLKKNPEYYTVWNHRRRIYVNEFDDLARQVLLKEIDEDNRISQMLDIIQLDLQFLFPLLLKFPKCYWIWNHRLWLLEQSTALLPATRARKLWEEELGLVGKMLNRDSRNFHGWGYRRTVVQSLESPVLQGQSMARSEFAYTKKMIGSDLSNFSAWHNRTKLILRILDEEKASDQERQKMLEEELDLIHKALFDPYDQSLWFYHQNLMCTFDPDQVAKSMAPRLSNEQRLGYVAAEREYIEEVLEDAQDCKWPYQALIECTMLENKIKSEFQQADRAKITEWLQKLKALDPLRKGRWIDMEHQLATS